MESVNELRELAGRCVGGMGGDYLRHIADKIEAEVAERYVALPTDADGVPICIFDLMETSHGVETVEGILGDRFLVLRGNCWLTIEAATHRHHHEPTVEDILHEMLAEIGEGGVYAEDVLLAKYAPKLRLAGDAE